MRASTMPGPGPRALALGPDPGTQALGPDPGPGPRAEASGGKHLGTDIFVAPGLGRQTCRCRFSRKQGRRGKHLGRQTFLENTVVNWLVYHSSFADG